MAEETPSTKDLAMALKAIPTILKSETEGLDSRQFF